MGTPADISYRQGIFPKELFTERCAGEFCGLQVQIPKDYDRYLRDQYGTDEVSKYAAPARETDYSNLPPCYTFCCTNEPFLAETKTYIDNLRKAGIPAELDIYEGLIHGFDVLMWRTKTAREAARRFEEHFVSAQNNYFLSQIT